MNPSVWGRIEPVELPLYEAVAKVGTMLPLVREDLVAAIRITAVLQAKHGGGMAMPADTLPALATMEQSLRLALALALARLFEFGTSRRFTQDGRDIASLPFLLRLLKERELQDYFANQARSWGETELADINEQLSHDLFLESFDTLAELESDKLAVATLMNLDGFRDSVLAHTLIDDSRGFYGQASLTFDLQALTHHATAIFTSLETAVSGMDGNYAQIEETERAAARRFWKGALSG